MKRPGGNTRNLCPGMAILKMLPNTPLLEKAKKAKKSGDKLAL
jgi:hypothetical protein